MPLPPPPAIRIIFEAVHCCIQVHRRAQLHSQFVKLESMREKILSWGANEGGPSAEERTYGETGDASLCNKPAENFRTLKEW